MEDVEYFLDKAKAKECFDMLDLDSDGKISLQVAFHPPPPDPPCQTFNHPLHCKAHVTPSSWVTSNNACATCGSVRACIWACKHDKVAVKLQFLFVLMPP